jgi:hypothetical protein
MLTISSGGRPRWRRAPAQGRLHVGFRGHLFYLTVLPMCDTDQAAAMVRGRGALHTLDGLSQPPLVSTMPIPGA